MLMTDQEIVQRFLDLLNRHPSSAAVSYSGEVQDVSDPDFQDHTLSKYGLRVAFHGAVDFYFTEGRLTKVQRA